MKVVKWKGLDDFLQKINQKIIIKDFTAYILSLETFFKSYTFG